MLFVLVFDGECDVCWCVVLYELFDCVESVGFVNL